MKLSNIAESQMQAGDLYITPFIPLADSGKACVASDRYLSRIVD